MTSPPGTQDLSRDRSVIRPPSAPTQRSAWRKREERLGHALLVPALLISSIVLVGPLLFNVYASFHDWSLIGTGDPEFVGFTGYVEALTDPRWTSTIVRTLVFVALTVGLQMVLGFAIAWFIFKNFPRSRAVKVILLFPMMISEVASALGWRLMLSGENSLVNHLLDSVGADGRLWFGPDLAFATVVWVDVWQQTPFVVLIMYAAMQGMPTEILESARVDGAARWNYIRNIVIPMVKPAIMVVLTFRTVMALRAFATIWVLTGGGPGQRTTVLGIDIYNVAFSRYDLGLAGVISVIMVLLSAVISYAYVRGLSRASLG